jgi:hypothetical protein
MYGACSTHGRGDVYKKFWLENLKGIDQVLTYSYYTGGTVLKLMLNWMGERGLGSFG